MPEPVPDGWELCRAVTNVAPEPMDFIRVPAIRTLMPDPAWITKWRATNVQHASLDPSYQAWRTKQVIRNLPLMGWDLERKSKPGTWAIVGNGPGAHVPPGCDHVLVINGALELVPDADLWMVADALRPNNNWGRVIYQWLQDNRKAVENATLVARVAARNDVCTAAKSVHFYRPCTPEHSDIIEPWIASRMPVLVDGMQSLPAALHLAWWMGATTIKLSGCPQGMPMPRRGALTRYYQAKGTPIPKGRFGRHVTMHGVNGLVRTTPEHLHALEHADIICYFLRRAGCRVEDHSGGLIYRYASEGAA